jgi:hypothetical protein
MADRVDCPASDAELRQAVRKLARVRSGGLVGRPFYVFQSLAWESWADLAKGHTNPAGQIKAWVIATELRAMQGEMDLDRSRHTNATVKPAAPMRYFDAPTPDAEEKLKPERRSTET